MKRHLRCAGACTIKPNQDYKHQHISYQSIFYFIHQQLSSLGIIKATPLPYTNSGASTSVTVASSLTSTCSDGPTVSLNGSPTVSPTTAAACAAEPLPITLPASSISCPSSMYFFALSHAPPPLFMNDASMIPL